MHEFSSVIMSHDGQILEKLLLELGVKKGVLADKLDRNANTITKMFRRDKIKNEVLLDIGKVLRFDIRTKFPRLNQLPEASKLNYFNEDPDALLSKVEEVEALYSKDQQEKADLRQQVSFLETQIDNLKEIVAAKNQIIEMQSKTITDLEKRNKG